MAYFDFYTAEHMAGVAAVLREMGYINIFADEPIK